MALCELFIQPETAYDCVCELGELGIVQFRDLNPDLSFFKRKYVEEIHLCQSMEHMLRLMEKEIKKDKIHIVKVYDKLNTPQSNEIIELYKTIAKLGYELQEVNNNSETLLQNKTNLEELKQVLRKSETFFEEAEREYSQSSSTFESHRDEEQMILLSEEISQVASVKLGFVTGVILRSKISAFERMLWRACRGNVFLRTADIEPDFKNSQNSDLVFKSVFIIFYQGQQLKHRIKKICDGFHASLYPCPETRPERNEMMVQVVARIQDLETVIQKTQQHRYHVLVAAARNLEKWSILVLKIKATYHVLNMFNVDSTHQCLVAELWTPIAYINSANHALQIGTNKAGGFVYPILNKIESNEEPPTYFRTNKYTNVFQEIIDAYGAASYQELNPAPFTIITFPFLFAIMFGDVGHAMIMTAFASLLIIREKKIIRKQLQNDIAQMFFAGRYIILLMGIFSIYTGIIYNDVGSKSFNIFKSSWSINITKYENQTETYALDPIKNYKGTPYIIGVDPVWQLAQNKIVFQNSFKMKISIILGVFHMLFGLCLSMVNNIYFKRIADVFFVNVPQILFLCCLFLYLSVLIIIKWCMNYSSTTGCAPSVLITFINMFLMKTSPENETCDPFMIPYQAQLQFILIIAALICVPWLLVCKPIYIIYKRQLGEESMGEMFIHQGIITIEYILGTVSHTASYLRLWALSLAHSQLTEVLWLLLNISFKLESMIWGCLMLSIMIFVWMVLTLAILVLMEGLSAFLHCLRLHWVEFQSKFYQGTGVKFIPFYYNQIIQKYRKDGEDF